MLVIQPCGASPYLRLPVAWHDPSFVPVFVVEVLLEVHLRVGRDEQQAQQEVETHHFGVEDFFGKFSKSIRVLA